jgi:hypothetical protein
MRALRVSEYEACRRPGKIWVCATVRNISVTIQRWFVA